MDYQAWLSCPECVWKICITVRMDSDELQEYTQALYASRRTRKKIAARFLYHPAADCLSKYHVRKVEQV